ncbi:hypothetical protein E2C01_100647 [Portunus trituberculatus]|uniref:Uncharacterized protein n=1 Tax=Portunus trituberculatus TaxID=210409 RepID=A0A5B7K8L1_PORTR|nr:hypothetical protein [Portunus trituberculatus]
MTMYKYFAVPHRDHFRFHLSLGLESNDLQLLASQFLLSLCTTFRVLTDQASRITPVTLLSFLPPVLSS